MYANIADKKQPSTRSRVVRLMRAPVVVIMFIPAQELCLKVAVPAWHDVQDGLAYGVGRAEGFALFVLGHVELDEAYMGGKRSDSADVVLRNGSIMSIAMTLCITRIALRVSGICSKPACEERTFMCLRNICNVSLTSSLAARTIATCRTRCLIF